MRSVAPSFARRAVAADELAAGGVAVFFATDPANLYQFEQWRRPLEALARRIGVFVIVDRPDTGIRRPGGDLAAGDLPARQRGDWRMWSPRGTSGSCST